MVVLRVLARIEKCFNGGSEDRKKADTNVVVSGNDPFPCITVLFLFLELEADGGLHRDNRCRADDHTLTKQIQSLHNPDGRIIDVRPIFQLVEEIIKRATQTTEGSSEEIISERESLGGKRPKARGVKELLVKRLGENVCDLILAGNVRETNATFKELLLDEVKGDGHVFHPRMKDRILGVECGGDIVTEDSRLVVDIVARLAFAYLGFGLRILLSSRVVTVLAGGGIDLDCEVEGAGVGEVVTASGEAVDGIVAEGEEVEGGVSALGEGVGDAVVGGLVVEGGEAVAGRLWNSGTVSNDEIIEAIVGRVEVEAFKNLRNDVFGVNDLAHKSKLVDTRLDSVDIIANGLVRGFHYRVKAFFKLLNVDTRWELFVAILLTKRTLHGLEKVVERITCEISCKIFCGVNSNETTLTVLKNLESFSWEAKAVLTLAAFAQTYGDFWFLIQLYSTNSLSKSEELVKQVPMIVDHDGGFKKLFEETNDLIKAMLETVRCIVEFMELPVIYITAEDPEVKSAMSHFPIAVYWVVRSCIAAAIQITALSSSGFDQNLVPITETREFLNWTRKLTSITEHLRNTLTNLYRILAEKKEVDAYNSIVQIINHEIHIDNMKAIKCLIYPDDDVPPLYDGSTKKRLHLDVLRRKTVLLLISGLDISNNELYLIEQSYTESRVHGYEIVWIPVLDRSQQWTDTMQIQFETLQKTMPWYSVHHPSIISNAATNFFRNYWHYKGTPILVVLSPQGKVLNENAILMMWIWQNEAYDFTRIREERLWEEERWRLELLVDNIDPKVQEWIRNGKYIFLYGGDDIDWIRRFTKQARSVAQAFKIQLELLYVGRSQNTELVQKVNAMIRVKQLSHCWEDPDWVWFFWTRIESMIHSKVKLEKINHHGDIILQEIQRLHSHDKTNAGWALLAKGSTILVHGPGKIALTALEEKDQWTELGIEPGYVDYFAALYMKMFPCHRLDFPANINIPNTMFCSHCRRNMQKYNSFVCCHEDAGNPV
ncbi:protein SIEVE ELEMENT OCCLUSION B-like [Silene latifolia]|uniref:protein SIEVE ELEMENT OCCLUSION B-like n=1 Tax=Silene latifolia TaxID=37657 RepID=UPI003D77FB97